MIKFHSSCKVCGLELPIDQFYVSDRNHCKKCICARVRKHRAKNDHVREYDRRRHQEQPHRKAHARKVADKWRKDNPEGYRAHNALNNAIRDDKIRKKPCQICGEEKVHGHHYDYSKPLDVIWLCPKHHAAHSPLKPENRRG